MTRNRMVALGCGSSLAVLLLASPGHAQSPDQVQACGQRLTEVEDRMAELDLAPEQQRAIDQLVESARVFERIGREQSCLTVLAEVEPMLTERQAGAEAQPEAEPEAGAQAQPASDGGEERFQAQLQQARTQLQQADTAPADQQPQAATQQAQPTDQQAQTATAPRIILQQPPPQVTVRIPEPEITIEIPQPTVIVQMPEPDVQIQGAEPEVTVEVADPQITISQPEPPRVQIQPAGAPAQPVGEQQPLQQTAPQDQQQQSAQQGQQQQTAPQDQQQQSAQQGQQQGTEQHAPAEQRQAAAGRQQGQQEAAPVQDQPAATPQSAAERTWASPPPEIELAGVAAEDLVGREVRNRAGDTIAEVAAIVRQRDDDAPFAVLVVGGLLGMGGKEVAVAVGELEMGAEHDALLLPNVTEEQLEDMPPYNPAMYDPATE